MDRLSALDASFLRVETPTAHMHIGWVATLELPAGQERLDADALRARIAGRLHHAPRFRQRVATVPGGFGGFGWEDDPAFVLDRHVTVDGGGGRLSAPDARHVVADFLSQPLPRDRALWQIHVVPRVRGRRALLLGKIHHAMVDGLAAVQLGMLLFDGAPDAPSELPVRWSPQPPRGPLERAAEAAGDVALEQFRAARGVASMALVPGRGLRMADTMRRAAFNLAEDLTRPAPPSYLNEPIGARRTLSAGQVPLAQVQALRRRAGASVNDMVLALVAGTLRRLAAAQGSDPEDVRAMVPASVRGGTDAADGNAIAFVFVDLPVAERSAARRLELVRERMLHAKGNGRVASSDALLNALGHLPGALQTRAAHLAASPRMYNLTVSNVPGPPVALWAAGARVRDINPVIPIPDRHALAVGALTYDGRLNLAAYADPEALRGTGRFGVMVADSMAELQIELA